jgi:WD40 repeat protein
MASIQQEERLMRGIARLSWFWVLGLASLGLCLWAGHRRGPPRRLTVRAPAVAGDAGGAALPAPAPAETGAFTPRWLAWWPDGQRLSVLAAPETIQVWRFPEGVLERSIPVPPAAREVDDDVLGAVWSPHWPELVAAALEDPEKTDFDFASDDSAQWSPARTHLALISRGRRRLRIWEAATGRFWGSYPIWADAMRIGMGWSPDGRTYVFQAPKGVAFWRVGVGVLPARLWLRKYDLCSFDWSPDCRYVATYEYLSGFTDDHVTLWDGVTGRKRGVLRLKEYGPAGTSWHPDSRTLAVGDEGRVTLWDAATGRRRTLEPADTGTERLHWSGDGRSLLAIGFERVVFWNPRTGRQRTTRLKRADRAAVDPAGHRLAVEDGQGIAIWDLATGQRERRLPCPEAGDRELTWSPDGRFLVESLVREGSQVAEATVWEAAAGEPQETLRHRPAEMRNLEWSPDSRFLVLFGPAKQIVVWNSRTGRWWTHDPSRAHR